MKKALFIIISIGSLLSSLLIQEPITTHADSTYDIHITNSSAPDNSSDTDIVTAAEKIVPAVVTIVGTKDEKVKTIIDLSQGIDKSMLQSLGIDPTSLHITVEVPHTYTVSGSGFIVTHDGYVLTNNHVVSDAGINYTATLYNGSEVNAKVVYRDQTHDVAVVKIDGNYDHIASLGDSSEVAVGDTIASLGNAYGFYNNVVSLGSISGLNKKIVAQDDATPEKLSGLIQSNAHIVPGYSGGPVIDPLGNVIGMNVATGAYRSYFIPINIVKKIVQGYIS